MFVCCLFDRCAAVTIPCASCLGVGVGQKFIAHSLAIPPRKFISKILEPIPPTLVLVRSRRTDHNCVDGRRAYTVIASERARIWRVRITWPNGKANYFGRFSSEKDAIEWVEAHARLTESRHRRTGSVAVIRQRIAPQASRKTRA